MVIRMSDPAVTAARRDAERRHGLRNMRLNNAARLAKKAYPGPVGVLCARELRAYAEVGSSTGCDQVLIELADHLLANQ